MSKCRSLGLLELRSVFPLLLLVSRRPTCLTQRSEQIWTDGHMDEVCLWSSLSGLSISSIEQQQSVIS